MSRKCANNPTVAGLKGPVFALRDGVVRRVSRLELLKGASADRVVVGASSPAAALRGEGISLSASEAAAVTGSNAARLRRLAASSSSLSTDGFSPGEHVSSAPVFEVDGRQVIFGVRAAGVPDGVAVVARNPYEYLGFEVGSVEGFELAVAYTAALAAVNSAVGCISCGLDRSCHICLASRTAELRDAVTKVLGPDFFAAGKFSDSVVDALLLRAAAGDVASMAEFKVLAGLGEQMIALEKAHLATLTFDAELRERVFAMDNGERRAFLRSMRDDADREENELEAARQEFQRGDRSAAELGEFFAKHYAATDAVARRKHEIRAMETIGDLNNRFSVEQLFVVHETTHPIVRDADGNIVLSPAEDHLNDGTRPTLHFALNHVVTGHMWRNEAPEGRVIVTPLVDVLEANPGSLENLFGIDTWFSTAPGESLKLPGAQVIEFDAESESSVKREGLNEILRAADAPLFSGGEHHSTNIIDDQVFFLSRDLGIHSSTGHQNTPTYFFESQLNAAVGTEHVVTTAGMTPERLAPMNAKTRARLAAGGQLNAAGNQVVRNPDDDWLI